MCFHEMPHNNTEQWAERFTSALIFLCFLFSNSAVALANTPTKTLNAHSEQHSGIVGDIDAYKFKLSPSESILIEVTQPNNDLKLVLFDVASPDQNTLLFEASIPAKSWVSERILVSANQCLSCLLQIQPVADVDKSGHYQLTSTRLAIPSKNAQIQFESLMSTAAIHWFIAGEDRALLTPVYESYLNATELAGKFEAGQSKLRSLYLAATAAHFMGDYDPQQQLLLKLTRLDKDSNSLFHLRAIFDLGVYEHENGQLKQSTTYFEKALVMAKSQNDDLMLAKTYSRLGLLADAKGDYQQAQTHFTKAYEEFIAAGDWHGSILGLINLGWSNYRYGDLVKALQDYNQALSFATKTGALALEVNALTKIGSVYGLMGDINQAIEFINQALVNSNKFSHSLLDGWAKQAKAMVLLRAGMFELAKDVFKEAGLAYEKVKSAYDVSIIHYYLGRVHYGLGNYAKAQANYLKTLEYDKQTDNNYDIATGYNSLAETALAQKNYSQALDYQNQALEYLNNVDNVRLKGRVYSQTALTYFYNNLAQQSQSYFQRAKQLQNEDYFGSVNTDYRIAIAQAGNGNKKAAVETLSALIKRIQSQRAYITRGDIRRSHLALRQKVAGLQIRLMQDTNASAAQTLTLSEMFRSQTLNEKLHRLTYKKSITQEQVKQRKALQQKLQSRVIDYHQLSAPVNREKVIAQTRKIASQLQQLEASFATKTEQTDVKQTPAIDIQKLQAQLDTNALILYFDTSPFESHLWAISNDIIELFNLPTDKILSEQVSDVLKLVKEPPNRERFNRRKKQLDTMSNLTNTLFGDINIDWQRFERIIVIPDGPINYLPLSMLTLPQQSQTLVEYKQVTYAPSLGVWQQLANRQPNDGQQAQILLVANPAMSSTNNTGGTIANLRGGFETGELPYTKKEADSVIKIAGSKVSLLSRENASKNQLLATKLTDYQILHFATHGLANSDAPSLGGLVLSNANSANNLLLMPEIINLNINAELVVLSGCETAVGKLIDGEGLQGLNRAFFEAGAKRVIASLWSVQDDATATLMGAFYRLLLIDKKAPGEALRLAKLVVKNHQRLNGQKPWQDPFYWAGFVLQGTEGAWLD